MDRRQALTALGATIAAAWGSGASAQTTSGKPARFIVGYPAGGVADFAARTVVNALANVPAIVENRSGAAGNIALDYVSRQPGDAAVYGVFANSIVSTNPFVPQLAAKNVDPMKDLVPVAALADLVLALAVTTDLGVENLDQFLAKARTPGKPLRIGLAGLGTPHHFSALLLQRTANLDLTLVPYKGGAPMIADAAGGHLDAVFTTLPVGGPMVAAGKLRWIAIVQPTTLPSLPGIPSLAGVFQGATVPSWVGVWAPANTPPETVNAMHAACNSALRDPSVSARLRENGLEPLNLSLQETAKLIADERTFMKDFLGKVKLDFAT
jgi:tripartite-type tricarboxylate transporter receptor subunit TctC